LSNIAGDAVFPIDFKELPAAVLGVTLYLRFLRVKPVAVLRRAFLTHTNVAG
jgi:hypothetical protein